MTASVMTNKRVFLRPEGDDTMILLDLVDSLEKGSLVPPPHQREFVWNEAQIKAWFETLEHVANGGQRPLGAIGTYQIENDPTIYINDGFQRLTASFLYQNRVKDKDKAHARAILGAYRVVVQHRLYENHNEAMFWFQRAQGGSPLTNYEFCACYLRNSPTDTNWLPTLDKFHRFCENLLDIHGGKTASSSSLQIRKRADYGLLYAWMHRSKVTTGGYTPVNLNRLDFKAAWEGKTVEQRLLTELEQNGIDEVMTSIQSLQQFLDEQVSLIRSIWNEHYEGKRLLSSAVLRWFIHVAIWRRNNDLTHVSWEIFLRQAIPLVDNRNRFFMVNSQNEYQITAIQLGSCGTLSTIVGEKWLNYGPFKQAIIDNMSHMNKKRYGYL